MFEIPLEHERGLVQKALDMKQMPYRSLRILGLLLNWNIADFKGGIVDLHFG